MRMEAAAARTTPDPVAAARALGPHLRTLSTEIEQARRLPADVVDTLRDAGLFRLGVPVSVGGLEADVATLLRAIETVSEADGSAGWCVMIGATSGLVSAYLPRDEAAAIFRPQTVAGGVFAPQGRAVATADGYRVSGRWAFGSGVQHCDWVMGGCVVTDEAGPRVLPSGIPDPRMMLVARPDVEVIDTWDVSGLRGTGSHDFAFHDVLVPESRSVSLVTDRPREPGPLYRFPVFGLLALGIAAVGVGIARRAIDELVELAAGKTPQGSRRKAARRPMTQADAAKAEALWGSARAYLYETVEAAWDDACSGEISLPRRARLRLAATNAARSCADAVDACYDAGGGSSIYASNPLQRLFRDAHTVTQHMMVAPATYELAGRVVLGVETDAEML
jgi:alkylation response protein AidB-like acyl-CoA dehydrogenase